MTDQMPMFEDPIPPQEVPAPPKKPRQKPTRKNKTVKVAAPKPAKKRRKRRVVAVVKTPRLAVMFDACAKISEVLRGLTPKERSAVIESIGHVA